MKIAILKIALTIYSKQWIKEASFYSRTNYAIDMSKEHNSSRRSCKMCNGKHVTTFQGYLKNKATINSDKGLANDEGVKYASVNTGTDVISMCVIPIKVQYGNSSKILETHALLDSCSEDTFILERLINNLDVKGKKTSIAIKILTGQFTNKAMVVKGLKVMSGNGDSND